jgi:hypothetical protein
VLKYLTINLLRGDMPAEPGIVEDIAWLVPDVSSFSRIAVLIDNQTSEERLLRHVYPFALPKDIGTM